MAIPGFQAQVSLYRSLYGRSAVNANRWPDLRALNPTAPERGRQ